MSAVPLEIDFSHCPDFDRLLWLVENVILKWSPLKSLFVLKLNKYVIKIYIYFTEH